MFELQLDFDISEGTVTIRKHVGVHYNYNDITSNKTDNRFTQGP